MSIEELVNRAYTTWAHDKGTSWTDLMRAALTEQAEAYEQRIRELEAQRVPDGWKLVPIYPTSDMVSAFYHCEAQGCQFAETYWDAMLTAAPAPKEDTSHD